MHVYTSAQQLIGNTPLLQLQRLEKELGLCAHVYAKLERSNIGGSAKDRAAAAMLDDAQARGLIAPGATIIEPTSGNTGIALAMLGAIRGYQVIIVMPDTMSPERAKLMRAYGAEVVLTPGAGGMRAAIDKANELAAAIPGSFIPDQFSNKANAQAHYATTGPEIFRDTDGLVDIFVAGVGTGGTLTGVGGYLKAQKPNVQVVAVEPAASPLLSGGSAGAHGLQGIGANFVPEVLDTGLIDRILTVTEAEAYAAAQLLASKEGVLTGISSGAALHAALTLAGQPENRGKHIVTVLPDTGERYLSTTLFP